MQSQFKILYVDDHEGLRNSMGSFITQKNPKISFVFAKNKKEALERLRENPEAAVALIDLNLGSENGLTLIEDLRKISPALKIVVYTMFTDFIHIEQALRKNIEGFVTKDAPAEELEKALLTAASGNFYFSKTAQKVMKLILRKNSGQTQNENKEDALFENYKNLTSGEKEIFDLAAEQKTNKEIAEILGKSEKNVRNRISVIYQKMNLESRMELLKAAKILGVEL